MTETQYKRFAAIRKPRFAGEQVRSKNFGDGIVVEPFEPQFQKHIGFDRYWVNFGNYTCLEYCANLRVVRP